MDILGKKLEKAENIKSTFWLHCASKEFDGLSAFFALENLVPQAFHIPT
jgi:hypothetical protein